MRFMPKWIGANGIDPEPKSPIPSLPAVEWHTLVLRMIGRAVSQDEEREIERMARHHWTARVTAEAILGRALTEAEVMAAMAPPGADNRARNCSAIRGKGRLGDER